MNKTNSQKVFFGGVKKHPGLKLFLFALVGIIVLSTAGYFGYSAYKVSSLKAKAGGWSKLVDKDGYRIWACKVDRRDGLHVVAIFQKPVGVRAYYYSGSGVDDSSKMGSTWWGDTVAALDRRVKSKGDAYYITISLRDSEKEYVSHSPYPYIVRC